MRQIFTADMKLFLFIITLPALFSIPAIFAFGLFKKAGEDPKKLFIPYYNLYTWLKLIEKSAWWYLWLIIPFVNVFSFMLMIIELIKGFGKNKLHEEVLAAVVPFIYLPWLSKTEAQWKKPSERPKIKKTATREWLDAIIFAVVAASIIRMFLIEAYTIPTSSMEKSLLVGDYLFVSKMAYGPKAPETPIAFPFVHHTLPFTKYTKSYIESVKIPYYRFPGFGKVKRMDAVVFNYPSGDTVVLERQNEDYYQIVRDKETELAQRFGNKYYKGMGRQAIWDSYTVRARPVDKRENYIKRCVAIAGDIIEIKDGVLYRNHEIAEQPENMQFMYDIHTNGTGFNQRVLDKLNVTEGGRLSANDFVIPLTTESKTALQQYSNVQSIEVRQQAKGEIYTPIFPHDPTHFAWNQDNFGPLQIPQKDLTVNISTKNIALYKKIISVYEHHLLEIKGEDIYIDGNLTNSYTFAQDYYWMMGDNRHNSADSRYWGFVPEDHIVGKAVFVWLSMDPNKSLFNGKIRWNKLFRLVK